MKPLKIIIAPNPVLRNGAKTVKKISTRILDNLKQMERLTRAFVDPEGVGLAATQVGISEQYFIAKFEGDNRRNNPKPDAQFTTIFNPQITWFSKRQKNFLEGCLSIPDYYGEVTRPTAIKVKYMDINGSHIQAKLTGINAMIFQHEYDHLHGKLFIDYVLAEKSRLFKITGKDAAGADIFEEVAF